MRFILILLGLFLAIDARADRLANIVEFTPAAGWTQVEAREPGQSAAPMPTIKFAPPGGRHAEVLLTLMMSGNKSFPVTDAASLNRFNLMSATPYLPRPDSNPPATELKVADGIGLYRMHEDP